MAFVLAVLSLVVPARAVALHEADSPRALSAGAVCADAAALRRILEGNAAYLLLNGYDYAGALAELCRTTRTPMPLLDLVYRIEAIIGRLQDSHSKVTAPEGVAFPDTRELPFAVAIHAGRVVALGDEGGLLVAGHPYLVSINGISVARLLEVSGARFRGHSRQRFLARAAAELRSIPSVLYRLGADRAERLTIATESADGQRATREMSFAERQPRRQAPTRSTRMIGDIAYLRVALMWSRREPGDNVQFDMIRAALDSADFARSRALIIDVRDNDGGWRDPIDLLIPYFITAPLVYNVAYPVADTVELEDRGLVSASDPGLAPGRREAVLAFLRSFQPRWRPTGVPFLDQPYIAMIEDRPTPHDYSGRPVIILMNEGAFSATDIFLGAMQGLPNVTLIGTTSAGGSGRGREFTLPSSGIVVRVSTMASFRPDGRLYDGYGVAPDVQVEPTLSDVLGRTDSQLDAAIRRLSSVLSRTNRGDGRH